ncbi:MAG: methenyltetrahydromethanopterin cyclohydrolase, partial [Clostridiales bacterium]
SIMRNEDLFEKLNFVDESNIGILCLETGELPTEETVLWIAEKSQLLAKNIYILVAPTSSLVGSIQIAARSVETGLHKMLELGYDISHVQNGFGIAPVPLLCNHDGVALGRTNDAILYGSTVHYNIDDGENDIKHLCEQIPSLVSKDYGTLFKDLMIKYDNKFYDIDPLLFSPAEVYLNHKQSGISYKFGQIRSDLLKKSFNLED